MQKNTPSIVVLISGRGSNLNAILAHAHRTSDFQIAAVLSNRPQALGLHTAQAAGLATQVVDHTQYPSREAFDAAMAQAIDVYKPDLVVLAGFMRILTTQFVRHYEGRLVNIHPSLLPAFPGLHTHQAALDAGVRVHGATVHLVTAQLDHGPILDQAVVPVLPHDTADTLAARVLELEHHLYPRAIANWLNGNLTHQHGRVEGALQQPLLHALAAPTTPANPSN